MANNEQPLIDFKKLTPGGIIFSFFFFISVVSPGFLYFYLFHRNFFISIDWIKLLFLSGALTMPFLMINTFFTQKFFSSLEKDDEIFASFDKITFTFGAYTTACVFYISMGYAYFFIRNFVPFQEMFMLIFVDVVALVVLSFSLKILHKKMNKKKKTKTPD
ncbi:MAG TPA: hypothetical protein VFJ43_04135 [Bacteroidia bacterium]|nr:hypothetical protein [Bacteroidia bacterium]